MAKGRPPNLPCTLGPKRVGKSHWLFFRRASNIRNGWKTNIGSCHEVTRRELAPRVIWFRSANSHTGPQLSSLHYEAGQMAASDYASNAPSKYRLRL